MSRFRKGNQFPDLNTPGDPRTLAAIERRTPSIAGGSVHHYHGGIVLTPKKNKVRNVLLPFQITATAALLKAAPGVLDGVSIAATEQATPADGVWYCQAKIVINSTTGAVSSRTVGWSQTYQTNTTTDFYGDIGEIEYIAGAPDMDLLVQYNYGPLLMVLHGAVSEKWALRIY